MNLKINKIVLTILFLLPFSLLAQNKFVIKGQVGKLNPPAKAYLVYKGFDSTLQDSAMVKNGKFDFKGNITGPTDAFIIISHDGTPFSQGRSTTDGISFYLDKEIISFVSKNDSIKTAIISGSKINKDNLSLKSLLKPINEKITIIEKEYRGFTTEQRKDATLMDDWVRRNKGAFEARKIALKKVADDNLDSFISLVAFNALMDKNIKIDITEPQFLKYSEKVRNTVLGKEIAKRIEFAKATEEGSLAVDFAQNDVNGKPVKLSHFKGKYVLLDFWASWCGPCRGENPNVVKAYNTYKDQNFTVLGVSLDDAQKGGKEAWLNAIEADGLTWAQLSDLKGWKNEVAVAYGIHSIPANFLIDPSGKIIAKNLRGEELQTKLKELLSSKAN